MLIFVFLKLLLSFLSTATYINDIELVAGTSRSLETSPKPTAAKRSFGFDLKCCDMSTIFVIQRFSSLLPPQFNS